MKKLTLLSFLIAFTAINSQVIYNTTRTVTPRNYTQDVHITNGATVKFTGNFKFAKNVRVYVENTSHIILENATFETLNSNDRWFGIEMQGYRNKPCTKYNSTAVILNSTVKGSIWGIVNTKVGSGQEVGALVHIENCIFDNQINVTLYNEVIHCGLSAVITNSTFVSSSQGSPYSVKMCNNKKEITGNTFKFTFNPSQYASLLLENSVGNVIGNTFEVTGSNRGPAAIFVTDKSFFFYKENISYSLNILNIKENIVNENYSWPYVQRDVSERKFVHVENNIFKGCPLCSFSGESLCEISYSCGGGGYYQNEHYDVSLMLRETPSMGIEVNGNKFTNQQQIYARGDLSTVVSGIPVGQQFRCNDFIYNGATSINAELTFFWYGNPIDQGFAFNNVLYSNKNTFSSLNRPIHNHISSNKSLNYYFYRVPNCSNSLYPCSTLNATRIRLFSEEQSCAPNLLSIAAPQDTDLPSAYRNILISSLNRYNQKISFLRSSYISPCYYDNIKDNYFPYILSNSDYADIGILGNYVENKLALYKNLTTSSELFALKNIFLSTYFQMKREINMVKEKDLYIRLQYDTAISVDSIKSLYRVIAHPSSEYKIAESLIERAQFDEAIEVYNNINNLYALDSLDSLNTVYLAELTRLKKTLVFTNRSFSLMSLSEINTLRTIADHKETSAGRKACSILGKVFGECSPEDAIYNEQNITVAPEINISPNPSIGITLIQISNAANSDNSYILKIFNAQGHLVFEQPLMGIELENIDLDISGWQNGNYYVSLFVNDVLFASKTLQKN